MTIDTHITPNRINAIKVASHILLIYVLGQALTGCATGVSVDRQDFSTTLVNERNNIITNDKLSDTSRASLRIAGIEETLCLSNFDECLTQVTDSLTDATSPESLALFAELYYADAQQLEKSNACQRSKQLLSKAPKYASASTNPSTLKKNERQTLRCLTLYHQRLNAALRHSFAYLFYDDLSTNSHYRAKVHLPNELDIQTLDIYRITSNKMIDTLYQTSQHFDLKTNSSSDTFNKMIRPTMTLLPVSEQITNHPSQIKMMTVNYDHNHLNVYIPANLHHLATQTQIQNKLKENTENKQSIDAGNIDAKKIDTKNKKSTEAKTISTLSHENNGSIDNLIPTAEIRLSGLNSVSKRQGFGLSYVAQLKGRYTNNMATFLNQPKRKDKHPESRIHHTGQVLLSGYVHPVGHTLSEVLDSHQFDIHLYDPYLTDEIKIFGKPYPLMANFSAGYATWLSENHLSTTSYANMLAQRDKIALPHLYMLEPYDPNKRVIIMVHGLVSSPATWVGVTNDIFNDRTLRDNYQVWQVFYSTNIPMIENRYQIQRLIETAYNQVDPKGNNTASKHSVIISHSMGGILSRMMLSNNDLRSNLKKLATSPSTSESNPHTSISFQEGGALSIDAKNTLTHNKHSVDKLTEGEIRKMLLDAYLQDDVTERFQLNAIPQVDTAVFINAPFRGTDFADRWFTRALRRIIHLPIGISKTIYGNLTSTINPEGLKKQPLGALFLENGASQLSDKSSFMQLTKDISIDNQVTYHTILASSDQKLVEKIQSEQSHQDNGTHQPSPHHQSSATNQSDSDPSNIINSTKKVEVKGELSHTLTETLSDGIVPYKSSHLEGAKSETILSGGHGIHSNPKTILLLRTILHDHLEQYPIERH